MTPIKHNMLYICIQLKNQYKTILILNIHFKQIRTILNFERIDYKHIPLAFQCQLLIN